MRAKLTRESLRDRGHGRTDGARWRPGVEELEDRATPATLTVNTTLDNVVADASLTLREAILVANGSRPLAALSAAERAQISGALNTTTPDIVAFRIGAGGPWTIPVGSAGLGVLPAATQPIVIDGWTQGGAGYSGPPLIELSGEQAGRGTGLRLQSPVAGSKLRGLAIDGFEGNGIGLASGNTVEGNYVGLNRTGLYGAGNGGAGVAVSGANNVIGGTTTGSGNVISNNDTGIEIRGAQGKSNRVIRNFLGTDATGTRLARSAAYGIYIGMGASDNEVGGGSDGLSNVVGGGSYGIFIDGAGGGASRNRVKGNDVGTDRSGKIDLRNIHYGVLIADASDNVIGGTLAGDRNVIANNAVGVGVHTHDGADPATRNQILGNYIGTDKPGAAAAGNRDGVVVTNSPGNTIGAADGGLNVISGNTGDGIRIEGPRSTGNRVVGNYVGLDATGEVAVRNARGVVVQGGASGNLVGGTTKADRNFIAGNISSNVYLGDPGTSGNLIQGNFIGTTKWGVNAPWGVLNSGTVGVMVAGAGRNTIGGTAPGAGNWIARHWGAAISSAPGTTILGNEMYGNSVPGIIGSQSTSAPQLVAATVASTDWQSFVVTGAFANVPANPFAPTFYTIELFAARRSSDLEGERLVGRLRLLVPPGVTAVPFSFPGGPFAVESSVLGGLFAGDFLIATLTNESTGDTSRFSAPIVVGQR